MTWTVLRDCTQKISVDHGMLLLFGIVILTLLPVRIFSDASSSYTTVPDLSKRSARVLSEGSSSLKSVADFGLDDDVTEYVDGLWTVITQRGCYPYKNCIQEREERCAIKLGGKWCGEHWPGCYCGSFRLVGAPLASVSYECVRRGGTVNCFKYDRDGHTCLEWAEAGEVTKCDNLLQGETG